MTGAAPSIIIVVPESFLSFRGLSPSYLAAQPPFVKPFPLERLQCQMLHGDAQGFACSAEALVNDSGQAFQLLVQINVAFQHDFMPLGAFNGLSVLREVFLACRQG